MEQEKLVEFQTKLSELLKEYNCTLQVQNGIVVVPVTPVLTPVERVVVSE